MDRREVIKLPGHLRSALKRRGIIQHQLAENLIDTVQLLQTYRAIQQRKSVVAHFKKTS